MTGSRAVHDCPFCAKHSQLIGKAARGVAFPIWGITCCKIGPD